MVECFEAGSNFCKGHQVEVEQRISPGPGPRTPGLGRGPAVGKPRVPILQSALGPRSAQPPPPPLQGGQLGPMKN